MYKYLRSLLVVLIGGSVVAYVRTQWLHVDIIAQPGITHPDLRIAVYVSLVCALGGAITWAVNMKKTGEE